MTSHQNVVTSFRIVLRPYGLNRWGSAKVSLNCCHCHSSPTRPWAKIVRKARTSKTKRRCMVVSAISARVRNSPQGGISSTHATSLGSGCWCTPATVQRAEIEHRETAVGRRCLDRVEPPRACGERRRPARRRAVDARRHGQRSCRRGLLHRRIPPGGPRQQCRTRNAVAGRAGMPVREPVERQRCGGRAIAAG